MRPGVLGVSRDAVFGQGRAGVAEHSPSHLISQNKF